MKLSFFYFNRSPRRPTLPVFLFLFVTSVYFFGVGPVAAATDQNKSSILKNEEPLFVEATTVPDAEPTHRPGVIISNHSPVATATEPSTSFVIVSQASTELSPVPFLVSWCEGKSCEHLYSNEVICTADIFADADDSIKKIGSLKVGESVESKVYYTKILKLGSYVSIEGTKKTLVSRASETSWLSFFDHAWDSENELIDPVTFPKTESWAYVRAKHGQSGFVKLETSGSKNCPFKRVGNSK